MPKVSIIVPAYNAEKVIGRCIESILCQSWKDFELLIIDDGSTDETARICDEYSRTDERIRVVHKPNSGVSDTRNHALSLAKGDYLQFLDADDWIVPEATEHLVRAAEENAADLVVADFYRVVKKWTSVKGSIDYEGILSREEFADCIAKSPADYYYGVLWNKLYRRDIIEEYHMRMDPSLRWCEDFVFNLEYILHIQSIYILRVPIYYYVKTEGSLVSQGMKIGNIVRMKLNIIEYYSEFFKNVLSTGDYIVRQPQIYGFLIDYSHDETALPMTPGTRRLGKERSITIHEELPETLWSCAYMENRMAERELRQTAKRFDIEYRALRVIVYLHHFHEIDNMHELSDFVGRNPVSTRALIEYLAMKEYVSLKAGIPSSAVLTKKAERICKIIDETENNIDKLLTEEFSEEEKTQYLEFRKRSLRNLSERLRK